MKKSMKLTGSFGCMILGLSLLSTPVFAATDYSSMSNEELAATRGTMRDAAEADQEAFRTEWQERVNNMSQEERAAAVGRPANAAQDGSGNKFRNGGGQSNGGRQGGGGGGMGKGRR